MSGSTVVLLVVMVVCVAAAVYGARWMSRYADAEVEKTKRALKAGHAVADPVSQTGPDAPGDGCGETFAVHHPGMPVADPVGEGRHHLPEELLRAATYRLSQDRVARARVPQPPVHMQRRENRRRLPCKPSADTTKQRVSATLGLSRNASTGAARQPADPRVGRRHRPADDQG